MQRRLREYLKQMGAVPRDLASFNVVSDDDLQSFLSNGNPMPTLQSPQFEWKSCFNSKWNTYMIEMLVDDFIQKVKAGEIKNVDFDEHLLSPSGLKQRLQHKLVRPRKSFLRLQNAQSSEDSRRITQQSTEEIKVISRHIGRRHGVCSILHSNSSSLAHGDSI